MAYVVERKKHITEEVHLTRGGKTVEVLKVDIVPDVFRGRFKDVIHALDRANSMSTETNEDIIARDEAARSAVFGLMEFVFGREQLEKLKSYFDGAYTEMLEELLPFITDVIAPQISDAAKERAERLKALMK